MYVQPQQPVHVRQIYQDVYNGILTSVDVPTSSNLTILSMYAGSIRMSTVEYLRLLMYVQPQHPINVRQTYQDVYNEILPSVDVRRPTLSSYPCTSDLPECLQ